jgi:hypothetical protein
VIVGKFRPKTRALVGTDFSAWAKQVGDRLDAENEARLAKQREAAAKHVYDSNHDYFLLVQNVGKEVHVESIEEFPLVGRLKAAGRNYPVACSNLRMLYALEIHKRKLLPTLDLAREYAAKCRFHASLT